MAKQEKYLKVAKRFLAEAASDDSKEHTERHDSIEKVNCRLEDNCSEKFSE
jgi:hypothetical protein